MDSIAFSILEPQTRHSPVIVGDHYELAETVALQSSGKYPGDLLAKTEVSAALLPMSGNAKPQKADAIDLTEYYATRPSQADPSLPEYNARRASQNLMYLQYGLPGAADPQFRQPHTAYDRQGDHMNHGASANDQPRAALEATPYHGFDLPTALAVTSYIPKSGTKGSLVSICLESSSELRSSTSIIATLTFARRSVLAALTFDRLKPQEQGVGYKYMIYTNAPAFSETGSSSLNVPLSLQLLGQSRLDGDLVHIGEWLYEDGESFFQKVPRKRKVTDDPLESPRSMKRVTPLEQETAPSHGHESYAYQLASSTYPKSQQTMRSQGVIGDSSIPQSLTRSPMCQTPSCISAYEAEYQSGRTSLPSLSPPLPVSSIASSTSRNPSLIRTILIPRLKKHGATSAGSSKARKLNPYALYSQPAVLKIHGDLDAIQLNWSSEEFAMKRRIVRFWREQNGTTVHTYFKSIRAAEHQLPFDANERRISCIYWDERKEYYVTSVDFIALLELLVGIALDVDEKNRIRRNLENLGPYTISKTKPISQDFHKITMSFINPKPRNIDKDVKVFRWAMLGDGLRKVVSRYSENPYGPSYAPTVTIKRSPSSNFSGTQSESGTGRYSALSSPSTSTSTASAAYSQTLKSNTLSPPAPSNGLPRQSQASPFQYLTTTPSLANPYTTPAAFDSSPYLVPYQTFNNSPYTTPVSTPDLSSSAYTTTSSTIARRRISDTQDILPSSSSIMTSPPYPNFSHSSFTGATAFAAPLESSAATPAAATATATLGLPGRASRDFSAYLNADVAQYGRHSEGGGMKDDAEAGEMCFKEEMK